MDDDDAGSASGFGADEVGDGAAGADPIDVVALAVAVAAEDAAELAADDAADDAAALAAADAACVAAWVAAWVAACVTTGLLVIGHGMLTVI